MNRLTTKLVSKALIISFVLVLLGFMTTPGYSDLILSDKNSTVQIDPSSQAGTHVWTVEGTNYLAKQWFWYRIGSTGPEQSIETLGLVAADTYDLTHDGKMDTAVITYGDLDAGLEVDLTYSLRGGKTGTGVSDMGEQIRFANNGANTLVLHFFQYANFKLSDGNDTVKFVNSSQVTQSSPGVGLSETVVTGFPQYHEAATVTTTLDKLNDQSATTLDNTYGPITGDVSWAFQWDITLGPDASFIISKDKALNVPEPSVLVLLGIGISCMAIGIRRRQMP